MIGSPRAGNGNVVRFFYGGHGEPLKIPMNGAISRKLTIPSWLTSASSWKSPADRIAMNGEISKKLTTSSVLTSPNSMAPVVVTAISKFPNVVAVPPLEFWWEKYANESPTRLE